MMLGRKPRRPTDAELLIEAQTVISLLSTEAHVAVGALFILAERLGRIAFSQGLDEAGFLAVTNAQAQAIDDALRSHDRLRSLMPHRQRLEANIDMAINRDGLMTIQ